MLGVEGADDREMKPLSRSALNGSAESQARITAEGREETDDQL
jgi:hypothetical protein